MKHSLRPAFWVLFGGIALSFLSLFVWLEANDPKNDMLFGRISQISTSTVTIANREGEETLITLTPMTAVFRGKEVAGVDILEIGDFLQVSLSPEASEEKVAQSVRLMRGPKDDKKYEPR
jgi:hypothetical protein